MGYESSYFGFGSPQQQVDMHARSKKHIVLKYAFIFSFFAHNSQRFVQRFIFPNPSFAWR